MRRSLAPSPCAPVAGCSRRDDRVRTSYAAVVDAYIRDVRERATREREFFRRRCSSLQRAVHYAACAKLPTGKRHPHQRRLKAETLAEGERRLQGCADALQS